MRARATPAFSRALTLAGPLVLAVAVVIAMLVLTSSAAAPQQEQEASVPADDQRVRKGFRTTLPLIVIETPRPIVDRPKVTARMRVIDNGRGELNYASDRGTDYDGPIGIEIRGQWSQRSPKKQFGLETRKASGKNESVSLLGLPKENDWVLHSSGTDSSLMRNGLAYWTARRLGWYASRTRFVELVLNGRYWGVYVLTEKPKLDRNRVVVNDDDVSGGYLLESSWNNKLEPEDSFFRAPITRKPIVFYDPERKDLSDRRAAWISDYVNRFERALYADRFRDPGRGYRAYLDLRAAVDYTLINEFFKNEDAFKASTFLHKSRGGKLVLGPVWDFDVSMENPAFGRSAPSGWLLASRPWAERLYQDPSFAKLMILRWKKLRRQGLLEGLLRLVDANARQLRQAQARNAKRWPATKSHRLAVAQLKSWLTRRAAWIDANADSLRPR